ncbi:MAG: hypothetical protein ACK41Y_10845 [Paracoccus hibiscisoli]|uniref:hypothetical protein n=1 Tax=Paracoccus hibiscisoli TaxID=2023261 RepID=UPI00391DC646
MTGLSPDELLAAEYVIGLLDRDQRRAAEDRLTRDPEWSHVVARWQRQMSQMDGAYDPVPAPDMLPRIEARLFGAPLAAQIPWWRRRPALLTGLIIGAVLAVKALLLALWLGGR